MLNRHTHRRARVPRQREARLCNPGYFASRWSIIYGRRPFRHEQRQHQRGQRNQFSASYTLGILWVTLFTLRAGVNVYQSHGWQSSAPESDNTKQPTTPPSEAFSTKNVCSQCNSLMLFSYFSICPSEAETTHLQTHIHTGIQKVCRAGPLWLGFQSLAGADGPLWLSFHRKQDISTRRHDRQGGGSAFVDASCLTVSMGVVRRPHAKNSRKMTTTAW